MPQRCMCPNFNWEYRMVAALQRRKLNLFQWREGMLSPRALVRGNPAMTKFAAENYACCLIFLCGLRKMLMYVFSVTEKIQCVCVSDKGVVISLWSHGAFGFLERGNHWFRWWPVTQSFSVIPRSLIQQNKCQWTNDKPFLERPSSENQRQNGWFTLKCVSGILLSRI